MKAKGVTAKIRAYNFTDLRPVVGVNYYRLKIDDIDKSFVYTSIRTAIIRLAGQDLDKFSIYPNPASRVVNIDFETSRKGRIELELCDAMGKLRLKTQVISDIGLNKFPLNISRIGEGTYFLKMTDGQTVSVQKLVVAF